MKTIFNIDKNFFNYGDSLLYESGETEIARLETKHNGKVYWASIQAIGHVCIYFKDEVYKNVSNFPDELIDAIREGKLGEYENRGELEIRENNWWEICFDNGDGEVLDCTPAEFKDSDEVYSTMLDYLKQRADFDEYGMIGDKKETEGGTLYKPDWSDEGRIYWDEEAYKTDPDAICYIPETAFDELAEKEDGYYFAENGQVFDAFTKNDLLQLVYEFISCEVSNDTLNNCARRLNKSQREMRDIFAEYICDSLFYDCDWAYPTTYLTDWGSYINDDLEYFVSQYNKDAA